MEMHRNAKLGLAGRYALVCAIDDGLSVKAAAAAFSVSPATACRWHRRWREASSDERRTLDCLNDRSSRPRRMPRLLPTREQRRICAARRRTGWGPRLLTLSVGHPHSTISKVLRRHGLSRPARPPREPERRYEWPWPRTNGKVERFHQTMAREWASASATAPLDTEQPRCHTGSATTTSTDHTAHSAANTNQPRSQPLWAGHLVSEAGAVSFAGAVGVACVLRNGAHRPRTDLLALCARACHTDCLPLRPRVRPARRGVFFLQDGASRSPASTVLTRVVDLRRSDRLGDFNGTGQLAEGDAVTVLPLRPHEGLDVRQGCRGSSIRARRDDRGKVAWRGRRCWIIGRWAGWVRCVLLPLPAI